jgi:hypothetical protein
VHKATVLMLNDTNDCNEATAYAIVHNQAGRLEHSCNGYRKINDRYCPVFLVYKISRRFVDYTHHTFRVTQ